MYQKFRCFFSFLIITGDQDGEGNMEHRVRDRKSISVSDHEVAIPSPKKNFVDTRGAKTNKFSPQSGCISDFFFEVAILFRFVGLIIC